MDIRLLVKEDDKLVEGGSGETRVQTQDESFNSITQSLNTGEIDPIWSQHVESTLADEDPGSDDIYYYYVDMDGFQNLSVQVYASADGTANLGSASFVVEATNQDDGTAPSSCLYVDVTNSIYGVSIASASAFDSGSAITLSEFLSPQSPLICKYARIKVDVSSDDVGDYWTWKVLTKKVY
jgi:hypothetical protein